MSAASARHPLVLREIETIARYIAQDNPHAAVRFVDACEQSFHHLAEFTKAGALAGFTRSRLKTVRLWPIPGFETYLIFYRPVRGGVHILHVVHGARDYRALFF